MLRDPVVLAADVSGLDALGDQPGRPEDATLALLATDLAHAESFDRLLSLERATGLLHLSHQEETARKVLTTFLGRALLADEVGLGKTIEAGLVLSEYLLRGRVRRALVLTPATLVAQWREELGAKFAIATRGTTDAAPWDGDGVVVASLATARSDRHRDAVVEQPWELVIVDEAHTVKNHRTESYALVERLKTRFSEKGEGSPVRSRDKLGNVAGTSDPGHRRALSVPLTPSWRGRGAPRRRGVHTAGRMGHPRHLLAPAIVGAALAVQLALALHVGDRAYNDVLKGLNFGHLLDAGAYDVSGDMVNSKTFVGPWLGYQLFARCGPGGLRAANLTTFVLLGGLVFALGRGRFDTTTRLLALSLFAFYTGTQRSAVAGELDDQLATLFLASGILVFLEGRRVLAGAVLVGTGFLFKFWVAVFGLGFVTFLLVTRRVRALPSALAGLGLPFVAVSLFDGGGSLHALLVSMGLSVRFSTWDEVAFKVFSTGLLPCALVAVASWREAGRRDVDTLFLCLASSYAVYVFAARDAHAASTMMMTCLVFSSHLIAAWMLRRTRALGPAARRGVAFAFLALYPTAMTTVAYVNLHRDTRPIRLFETTDEVASTFRYNRRLAELP